MDKSLSLAIKSVDLFKWLTKNRSEHIMSKQQLRAGTSVGAMIREANACESRKDFIHKLAIAHKEINEHHYWIEVLQKSGYLEGFDYKPILRINIELQKIISKSRYTASQGKNAANKDINRAS